MVKQIDAAKRSISSIINNFSDVSITNPQLTVVKQKLNGQKYASAGPPPPGMMP